MVEDVWLTLYALHIGEMLPSLTDSSVFLASLFSAQRAFMVPQSTIVLLLQDICRIAICPFTQLQANFEPPRHAMSVKKGY